MNYLNISLVNGEIKSRLRTSPKSRYKKPKIVKASILEVLLS